MKFSLFKDIVNSRNPGCPPFLNTVSFICRCDSGKPTATPSIGVKPSEAVTVQCADKDADGMAYMFTYDAPTEVPGQKMKMSVASERSFQCDARTLKYYDTDNTGQQFEIKGIACGACNAC